jgi:diacylglycerol kinase (ATP)
VSEKGAKGLKRLYLAGVNSVNGLRGAFRSEEAVRQEILLVLVAIPAAFWLTGDAVERVLLVMSVVLVLLVELLNTAVEYTVDRIGPEYHELSGLAKDIGSAAVLVSLFLAAFVWVVLLI